LTEGSRELIPKTRGSILEGTIRYSRLRTFEAALYKFAHYITLQDDVDGRASVTECNIARSTNAGILNYSGTILSFFIRAVEATRCIDRGEVGVEEFP